MLAEVALDVYGQAPVEEDSEQVPVEASVDDVAEPVLAEVALDVYDQAPVEEEEVVEQVWAEASVDDVGEPVLADFAPDVYDQAPVEEEEIVEQVWAEASVDDVGEPVLANVAPDVYDEAPVQEEEDSEQVLVEASFDDVGEGVLAEVAVEDELERQDDVSEADHVVKSASSEVATQDEPEPVVAETPVEAPAWRPRPLPTLAFEDVPQPEASFACVAYAPTTRGYRLVQLVDVPSPGETIDVPDVGARLVLRVGPSPLPADDRVCAFVEEPVVWASLAGAVA